MKLEYVFKHIKLILWGIAVAFMAQIIFSAQAYAQETPRTSVDASDSEPSQLTKIELLSETLKKTSDAIESATTISSEAKRALFVQLIEASRAILALQLAEQSAQQPNQMADDPGKTTQTLSEAGLHKVTIDFDYLTNEAVVTLHLDTPESVAAQDDIEKLLSIEYDTQERVMAMTSSAGTGTDFASVMSDIKQQIVLQLATEKNVNRTKLDQVTYMSSRNPIRGTETAPVVFIKNSPEAIAVAEEFGTNSIIKKVTVMPGARIGRVLFESDQDEIYELTVTRSDYKMNGGDNKNPQAVSKRTGVTFELETTLYHDDIEALLAWYDCAGVDSCVAGRPPTVISEKDLPGTRVESLEYINELFSQIPFTSSLRDANDNFLSFLVENPAYYDGGKQADYSSGVDSACIETVDELVMSEYVLQVLTGINANYVLRPNLIEYVLPVIPDDNGSVGCRSVQEFF